MTYREADGRLESVFCHVMPTPWPAVVDGRKRLAKFTPDAFVTLFGLRWSSGRARTYASGSHAVRLERLEVWHRKWGL